METTNPREVILVDAADDEVPISHCDGGRGLLLNTTLLDGIVLDARTADDLIAILQFWRQTGELPTWANVKTDTPLGDATP